MILWVTFVYFLATTLLAFWSLGKVANCSNCPTRIKKSITSLFVLSTFLILGSHAVLWDKYIPNFIAEIHTLELLWIMTGISVYDWLMYRVSCSMSSARH